jgi:cell wall-associated NlpC family hydrolase
MMKEIKSWIGTPYRFGKVEKGKGTDCSGFVGAVFQKTFNMNLPRQSSDMYGSGESISKNELKFGDLVFFQNTYKGSKGASHVGIYIGKDKFAHASTTVGVTISELSEDYYAKHYLGCRRVIKQ